MPFGLIFILSEISMQKETEYNRLEGKILCFYYVPSIRRCWLIFHVPKISGVGMCVGIDCVKSYNWWCLE